MEEKTSQTDEDELERAASVYRSISKGTDPASESELLNLDDINLDDEEDTWLYTSPKNLSKEQKGVNPYKWLRKDVEDPSNSQLQMAKTALVSKLDELDILAKESSERGITVDEIFDEEKSNVTAELKRLSRERNARERQAQERRAKERRAAEERRAQEDEEKTIMLLERDTSSPEAIEDDSPKFQFEMTTVLPDSELIFAHEVSDERKVSEMIEKARLQEEHLKFETSVRLSFYEEAQTFPRKKTFTKSDSLGATKYSSEEGLHLKIDASFVNIPQKKFLPSSHGLHRSSLPNINKPVISPKRASEPHVVVSYSSPTHPKSIKTGFAKTEKYSLYSPKRLSFSPYAQEESKTLPSSYRSKSKRNIMQSTLPPRRDSLPCLVTKPDESPSKSFLRRESAPCSNSITQSFSTRSSKVSTVHTRPIPAFNLQMTASPTKRKPLCSVHNTTPMKKDSRTLICDDEKSSSPSKIPSRSSRSGIPVPSTKPTTTSDSSKKFC